MRYFCRLMENVPLILVVNSLLDHAFNIENDIQRSQLRKENCDDTPAMAGLIGAKAISLGVMQMVNGSVLGAVELIKLEPRKKGAPHWSSHGEFSHYIIVVSAQANALYRAGDETINLRSGEVWRIGPGEELVINNSMDDLVLICVEVRVDE